MYLNLWVEFKRLFLEITGLILELVSTFFMVIWNALLSTYQTSPFILQLVIILLMLGFLLGWFYFGPRFGAIVGSWLGWIGAYVTFAIFLLFIVASVLEAPSRFALNFR